MFALVDWDNDVNEARKRILEEFNEMEEIYEVLKVYVDKSESFMDFDNVSRNSVDIFINTKEDANKWKDNNFRKQDLFQSVICGIAMKTLKENSPEKI